LYAPLYDALGAELEPNWQPISGFRSLDEQRILYAKGRTVKGQIVTNAAPGLSFHNYGLASDWAYFERGRRYIALPADAPRWQEYLDACEKVGLRCISWEKPHNELPLGVPARHLLEEYNVGGIKGLDALIEREFRGN
jgi:hypothetical protein